MEGDKNPSGNESLLFCLPGLLNYLEFDSQGRAADELSLHLQVLLQSSPLKGKTDTYKTKEVVEQSCKDRKSFLELHSFRLNPDKASKSKKDQLLQLVQKLSDLRKETELQKHSKTGRKNRINSLAGTSSIASKITAAGAKKAVNFSRKGSTASNNSSQVGQKSLTSGKATEAGMIKHLMHKLTKKTGRKKSTGDYNRIRGLSNLQAAFNRAVGSSEAQRIHYDAVLSMRVKEICMSFHPVQKPVRLLVLYILAQINGKHAFLPKSFRVKLLAFVQTSVFKNKLQRQNFLVTEINNLPLVVQSALDGILTFFVRNSTDLDSNAKVLSQLLFSSWDSDWQWDKSFKVKEPSLLLNSLLQSCDYIFPRDSTKPNTRRKLIRSEFLFDNYREDKVDTSEDSMAKQWEIDYSNFLKENNQLRLLETVRPIFKYFTLKDILIGVYEKNEVFVSDWNLHKEKLHLTAQEETWINFGRSETTDRFKANARRRDDYREETDADFSISPRRLFVRKKEDLILNGEIDYNEKMRIFQEKYVKKIYELIDTPPKGSKKKKEEINYQRKLIQTCFGIELENLVKLSTALASQLEVLNLVRTEITLDKSKSPKDRLEEQEEQEKQLKLTKKPIDPVVSRTTVLCDIYEEFMEPLYQEYAPYLSKLPEISRIISNQLEKEENRAKSTARVSNAKAPGLTHVYALRRNMSKGIPLTNRLSQGPRVSRRRPNSNPAHPTVQTRNRNGSNAPQRLVDMRARTNLAQHSIRRLGQKGEPNIRLEDHSPSRRDSNKSTKSNKSHKSTKLLGTNLLGLGALLAAPSTAVNMVTVYNEVQRECEALGGVDLLTMVNLPLTWLTELRKRFKQLEEKLDMGKLYHRVKKISDGLKEILGWIAKETRTRENLIKRLGKVRTEELMQQAAPRLRTEGPSF